VQLRVLLDVDGVLADFVGSYLRHVNAIHAARVPTCYQASDVTQWDIDAALSISKDVAERASANMGQPGECLAIKPYASALGGVRMLREIADVRIVTSPFSSATWTHERERWLALQFGIAPTEVSHTRDKTIVAGDALIDDKTSTLVAWQRAFPSGVAILWDQPWNQRDAWSGVRTSSWDVAIDNIRFRGGGNRTWHHEER